MNKNSDIKPENIRGVNVPRMNAVPVQVRSLSKDKPQNNNIAVKVIKPQAVPGPEDKTKSSNVINVNVAQIKGPAEGDARVADKPIKDVKFQSDQTKVGPLKAVKPIIEKPVNATQQIASPRQNPYHPGRTHSHPPIPTQYIPQENFIPSGMTTSMDQGYPMPSGRFSFEPLINNPGNANPLQRISDNEFLRRSNIISSQGFIPGEIALKKSANFEKSNIDKVNIKKVYIGGNEITLNRDSSASRLSPRHNNHGQVQFGNQTPGNPLRTSFIVDGQNNLILENGDVSEIRRLNQILIDKDIQMDHLQKRCAHLEKLFSKGNEGLNRQLKDSEERTILILNENEKLNKVLNDNLSELGFARKRIATLEKSQWEIKETEGRFLDVEGKLRHAMMETEQWKQKYYELEGDRTEKAKKTIQQDKLILEKEVFKFKDLLDQRNKEIEELKKIFNVLETKVRDSTKVKELEGLIIMLGIEIERLHKLFRDQMEESEALKHKNTKLEVIIAELRGKEARLAEYEIRCQSYSQEVERISREKRSKIEEAEVWRTKSVQLELNLQDRSALENDLKRYRDTLESRNIEIEEWRTKVNKLELNLAEQRTNEGFLQERQREAESKALILNSEAERLRNHIKQKDDTIDELKSRMIKFEFFNSQIQLYDQETVRLREIINERSSEGEQARRKVADLENKVADQKRQLSRLSEIENKNQILSQELERLTASYSSRLEEVTNLRSQLSNLESSSKISEIRLRDQLSEENNSILEKIIKENEAANKRILMMTQEIDKLKGVIKSREDDIGTHKMRINRMEIEVKNSANQEEKISLLTQEIQRLTNSNDEYYEEISNLRERFKDHSSLSWKLEDQLVTIVLMAAEIESIREANDKKSRELDDVRRSSLGLK